MRLLRWSLVFGLVLASINCVTPSTPLPEGTSESTKESGKETQGETASEVLLSEADATLSEPGPSEPRPDGLFEPTKEPSKEPGLPEAKAESPKPESPPEPKPEPTPEPKPEIPPRPDVDQAWLAGVSCFASPMAGAPAAAAPPAFSGGTCPALKSGTNAIQSKGNKRSFLLVLPANPKPNERFPVLFLWHWLKASANSFLTKGEIQQAADLQRFIAVIPESKKDIKIFGVLDAPWPFTTSSNQARYDEEFAFFDDMLSCVSAQFAVNKECVSSIGVSAGALFTAHLASARSQYLASFVSLSGGVGAPGGVNAVVRVWTAPPRKLPSLVLWGGPQDSCVLLNFQTASQELETHLTKDGHFFLECVHNCKHSEPPLVTASGSSKYAPIWDFVFKHPFWLPTGLSPYQAQGGPAIPIPWCSIGKGSATARTGACPSDPGCPI